MAALLRPLYYPYYLYSAYNCGAIFFLLLPNGFQGSGYLGQSGAHGFVVQPVKLAVVLDGDHFFGEYIFQVTQGLGGCGDRPTRQLGYIGDPNLLANRYQTEPAPPFERYPTLVKLRGRSTVW